jgi:Mor family transcriptional regulator
MKDINNNELVEDIIRACSPLIGKESVENGLHALCRTYGGQKLMIPVLNMNGKSAEKIMLVLEDEVGGKDAQVIFDKLIDFYAGTIQYIPLERCGFKRNMALEIYEQLNSTMTVRDFCRKYNISDSKVYSLWRAGRRAVFLEKSPCLDFG